jgi:diaminopimelate epimerase
MEGGTLRVSVEEGYRLRMTGPASEVYTGQLLPEFVELLRSAGSP